jgi:putative DNA primase/helicase
MFMSSEEVGSQNVVPLLTASKTEVSITKSSDLEPWPTHLNGVALAEELRQRIQKHVVLTDAGYVACTLWILHTYCYGLFEHTPRLHAKSPTKRCGKTMLLTLLNELVHEPLLTSDVSGAVLFRVIDHLQPTVLLDEWDSILSNGKAEPLRNVLNSGFERNGGTWRTERAPGGAVEPRRFSTFGPVAVASIGELPETVADRAIVIPMRRKIREETIENLRDFSGLELKQKCLRWTMDNNDVLKTANPIIPQQLNDRQANCWQVLLALSDAIGGGWGRFARDAAVDLCAPADDTEMIGEILLRDIHKILSGQGADRVFSKDLLRSLLAKDDKSWGSVSGGRPLTANKVGRLLSSFGIVSGTIRIGDKTDKGYYLNQFKDAWARYLVPDA